jgi:hypothetical protein
MMTTSVQALNYTKWTEVLKTQSALQYYLKETNSIQPPLNKGCYTLQTYRPMQ